MFRLGAHVSISDGMDAAVAEQDDLGGTAGQLFVGSPRTWAVSEVDDDDATAFREAIDERDIRPWITHGTYLINFATPKDDLAEKSVDCVQAELDACGALEIPYYTFHPGAHTGAGVETGLENIGERLSELDVPDSTTVLLENTAGKGTTLGKTMAHLSEMIAASTLDGDDLGICLDSCHCFAAGYDFSDRDGMDELVAEVDEEVGLDRLEYLHLNDSKHPLGSERDQHAHIGEGEMGEAYFEQFVKHPEFRDLPMVLETPVEDGKGYAWNIERVRELREE